METFNNLSAIGDAIPKAASQIVRKTAFDIQARAAAGAPVDTGNLRNSIYTKTSTGNDYPGTAGTNLVEDQVPDVDDQTAYVAVAASYGIYVEMGTIHQGAQPYLIPAADALRQPFAEAFTALEAMIQQNGGTA